jgi:Family of unknown function (DUF5990)
VDVRIVGVDLPGRRCADPRPDGLVYENVHVGVQQRKDVVDLVPADATTAEWNLRIETVTKDGALDFRGPFVHGKRGDRFLYLSWGTVDHNGGFEMFRRAKLMFDAVPDDVLRSAKTPGHRLVGTVNMTQEDGMPRCAATRPPAIEWTVEEVDDARVPTG